MKTRSKLFLVQLAVFFLCSMFLPIAEATAPAASLFGSAKYLIHVHKSSYRLDVYQQGLEEAICSFPIAVGKNPGDKQREGDNKTPTSWGNAAAIPVRYEGAYGPWFLSLDTGWVGIGIHGTHDPASIGTMASEGCIRLRNEDIRQLKEIICSDNGGLGTGVIITEA